MKGIAVAAAGLLIASFVCPGTTRAAVGAGKSPQAYAKERRGTGRGIADGAGDATSR